MVNVKSYGLLTLLANLIATLAHGLNLSTQNKGIHLMKTYALAIRKATATEYESPVIIIKRNMTFLQARESADRLNKTHKPECVAMGGDSFVAYNMQAI